MHSFLTERTENQKKWDKEEEMKQDWIAKNGNDTTNMPEFEYYDFENWILRNYYVYMTTFTQGRRLDIMRFYLLHSLNSKQSIKPFRIFILVVRGVPLYSIPLVEFLRICHAYLLFPCGHFDFL